MEIRLLKDAVPPLLEWYRVCKRDLPWRRNRNPYTALVAELMLQQTRVEAVKERYRFFSFGDAMFITDDTRKDNPTGENE